MCFEFMGTKKHLLFQINMLPTVVGMCILDSQLQKLKAHNIRIRITLLIRKFFYITRQTPDKNDENYDLEKLCREEKRRDFNIFQTLQIK